MARQKLKFSEAITTVGRVPGFYEIWTHNDLLLKVGISTDLRKRIRQHAESLQSGLVGPAGFPWTEPEQVRSNRSILAKHLYFDTEIAPGYDLRQEQGRRRFLEEQCRVTLTTMASRKIAEEHERVRQRAGDIRYVGRVTKR